MAVRRVTNGAAVRAVSRRPRAGARGNLSATVEGMVRAASKEIRAGMESRPLATLGLGLFGGYVLGNGLSVPLARVLLAVASRAAVGDLVGSVFRAGVSEDEGGSEL